MLFASCKVVQADVFKFVWFSLFDVFCTRFLVSSVPFFGDLLFFGDHLHPVLGDLFVLAFGDLLYPFSVIDGRCVSFLGV